MSEKSYDDLAAENARLRELLSAERAAAQEKVRRENRASLRLIAVNAGLDVDAVLAKFDRCNPPDGL